LSASDWTAYLQSFALYSTFNVSFHAMLAQRC
jgi:hypothetical protein